MIVEDIATLMAQDRAAARKPLDTALRSLHGSERTADLCALHRLAADYWQDDPEQAAFHLTHAYIYALEAGDEEAEATLYEKLSQDGRI